MAKLVCDVELCSEEISEGTGSKGGLPICKRCRAQQYKAKKMGVEWIADRKAKYEYFESRLDYLHPRVAKMLADAERRVKSAKRVAHRASV